MAKMKTALITGAAGGIGANVARRLNDLGYRLILLDINETALYQLKDQCHDASTVTLNLADRKELAAWIAELTKTYEHIDLAFINAGVVHVGNVLDLEESQIDLQLEINLRSAIHLIKACAKNMVHHGSGHIISTVSMGGIISLKGSATYSASKFGLRGFMTGIRDELKPLGVDVSGIYPSGVDTQMLRYEAQNGGSPLNFINTPQTVDKIGGKVIQALKSKRLEYYIPYSDSLSGRLASCFPWLIRYLYPLLEKIGERGRAKYLKQIHLEDKK